MPKREYKEVFGDEGPLSPIAEEIFVKYQVHSTNGNLTDGYNNLQIVPSQISLPFCFTTSSPVTMRNKSQDYLIRLLEGTEQPILLLNSDKLLSNEELPAIVRNGAKKVNSTLDMIHSHC